MPAPVRPPGRGDQSGSGTAIGVAIIFPMLMLVIVALRMLSDSARIEQGIQAAANQAARTAALCCHYTEGAETAAKSGLRAAGTLGRISCDNDVAGDSTVVFEGVDGSVVPIEDDAPVPAGGTVYVAVTCRVPPDILGGYGFIAPDTHRQVWGVATIDPFRQRSSS